MSKPFYSAIVEITDEKNLKKASDLLKFLNIDGKPCRALKFDS